MGSGIRESVIIADDSNEPLVCLGSDALGGAPTCRGEGVASGGASEQFSQAMQTLNKVLRHTDLMLGIALMVMVVVSLVSSLEVLEDGLALMDEAQLCEEDIIIG